MSGHLVRALMEQGATPHCFVHGTPSDVRGRNPDKYGHPWLDLFTGDRWWCVQDIGTPADEAEKGAVA